jgi:hypothetical protein
VVPTATLKRKLDNDWGGVRFAKTGLTDLLRPVRFVISAIRADPMGSIRKTTSYTHSNEISPFPQTVCLPTPVHLAAAR